MEDAKVTIIGAGKMARLLLVHLQTQDVKEISIVNRLVMFLMFQVLSYNVFSLT